MDERIKGALVSYIVGLVLGFTFCYSEYRQAHHDAQQWRQQWKNTRDSWMTDRRAWQDGKAFSYRYGPHGERW